MSSKGRETGTFSSLVLLSWVQLGGLGLLHAAENHPNLLVSSEVDGTGIFLHQIVTGMMPGQIAIRLTDAPKFGQAKTLTRSEISQLLKTVAPDLRMSNAWSGASSIRIVRKSRLFSEAELKPLLIATLQSQVVRDRGELELRLVRPWTLVRVPDETLVLRLLDVPASGVSGHFIVRFELAAGDETFGPWQVICQARVLKDVLVAKSSARRGQILSDADVVVERRDILPLRDPLDYSLRNSMDLELTEDVMSGFPILSRSIRARPVVQRGQLVNGIVFDGGMHISLKVEVLADAVTGQLVRVRNPRSKREFHAKVQDEQTVVISL